MGKGKWAVLTLAACVVVTVAAVACAPGRARTEAPEVIRAQRFELVDGEGRVRGALEVGLPDDSPGLILLDDKGELRAGLGLLPDGGPRLELSDEKSQTRAAVGVTDLEATATGEARRTAESSVVLFDREGKVIWRAP